MSPSCLVVLRSVRVTCLSFASESSDGEKDLSGSTIHPLSLGTYGVNRGGTEGCVRIETSWDLI